MALMEHEITLTWKDSNMKQDTITSAIDNILQMGDIKYEITWEKSCAKIQFQTEEDKIFLTNYKHKLESMGYTIQHEQPQDSKLDAEEDEDDDIDLQGITPGGDIPQQITQKPNITEANIPAKNSAVTQLDDIDINDLIEINSDPDDDDTQTHMHKGRITKKTKQQITIKEDTGDCGYFFDEVSITLIRKSSKANEESKENIKQIQKAKHVQNINKQPQESKENVKSDAILQQKPIEQPVASNITVPNAYFNENKNDNGTPELVEIKNEIKEKPLKFDTVSFNNESSNEFVSKNDNKNMEETPLDLVHTFNENDNDKPSQNDIFNKLLDSVDKKSDENDKKSDSETENYNEKPSGLDAIDVPTHSRHDSLFGNFGSKDNKRELEQENSAVLDAFGSDSNRKLISKSSNNLFPNITAPLQNQSKNVNKFNTFNRKAMGIPGPTEITQAQSLGVLAGGSNAHKSGVDTQFKCVVCNKLISAIDWTNNNVEQREIYGQIKWQHLYCKSYVSLNSQYSLGSVSSCTINALEATMQLQMKQKVNVKLIDKILELSALYEENKHTSVDDVFPYVSRYCNNLDKVNRFQINIKNLKNIINKELIPGISAIVTKPPETIFMHNNKEHKIFIYDSHPRSKQLKGSHFLRFGNKLLALKYLSKMWQYQNLGKQFTDLRAQQINMCDITLFKLKKNVRPSLTPDKKQMGIELKKIGVTLQKKWYKTYGNDSESKCENEIDEKTLDEKTRNYINKLKDKIVKLEQENNKLQKENISLRSLAKQTAQPPNMLKKKEKVQTITATFVCKKCEKKCKTDDKFIFTNCKCETCRDCAKKCLEQQLNKKQWPILCLICYKMECNPFDFQILFNQKIYDKYCELSQQQLLNKSRIQCSKCENILTVKEWNKTIKKTNKNKYYICPNKKCKSTFCVQCRIGYNTHSKLSCADALKIVNQGKMFRKCPNCQKLLVNKAGNKQRIQVDDLIVLCEHCNKYNCFKCLQSPDRKRENVRKHIRKIHAK